MARLLQAYQKDILPALTKELALKNRLQAPRLEKVVVNVGLGEAKDNRKLLEETSENLALITGQKPIVTKARKSIAGFKIRQGQPVGLRVTLRGERMYDFIDKLVNVTLPRLRDLRGLSKDGFDGQGNYNLGIREHAIFPEIHFDTMGRLHGMNITIGTTAKSDEQGKLLLQRLGFPFEKGV